MIKFLEQKKKNNAIIEKIIDRHEIGQPILFLHLVLINQKFIQLC